VQHPPSGWSRKEHLGRMRTLRTLDVSILWSRFNRYMRYSSLTTIAISEEADIIEYLYNNIGDHLAT
jgi:hypothetical protein